ncbi:MAG: dipeptidase [Cytophagales bacterium]
MKEIVEKKFDTYLKDLVSLLSFPSVSADPKFKMSVLQTADFVSSLLKKAGIQHVEIIETEGNPIVYAEEIISKELPTVLMYGHYDVQPADPIELWESNPFEPVVKDGKIYARGAADDKGQFLTHIKAVELLNELGELKYNLKILIEGEEEIGSDNLPKFVTNNKEKLKADVVLISDTSMVSSDIPSITTGLRGLSYVEVELTGPNRDLHSGVYGGAVMNPINTLCEMIASLRNEKGEITIPGFYDKVVNLSNEERAKINEIPFSIEEYKNDLGVQDLNPTDEYTAIELTGIRPTLDVNGIWGGYTGEGAKTVLPSKAFAKISMRLVPDQSPDEITELFTNHFEKIAPKGVKVKVTPHHGGYPAVTSISSEWYKKAELAYEKVWGKKPIPTRDGGSIPIVAMFQKELGIDTLLMGFGLDSDCIHSPNEHFSLEHLKKGILTIAAFLNT